MDAIRVACPVSVAGCEAEDGCLEIVEEALYHSIPRDGSDALMALVSCIKGDGDIGASVHTGSPCVGCHAPLDSNTSWLSHPEPYRFRWILIQTALRAEILVSILILILIPIPVLIVVVVGVRR